MDQERIKKEVERASESGVLSCHDARALAEQLGVPYGEVGKACNDLDVKVRACELGCF